MKRFLDLLDDAGAGWLAPVSCRQNLLGLDNTMSALGTLPLRFLEFPLLGAAGFDTTWSFLIGESEPTPAPPSISAHAPSSTASSRPVPLSDLMATLMPAPSIARSRIQAMMCAEARGVPHGEKPDLAHERLVMVEYDTSRADLSSNLNSAPRTNDAAQSALMPSFHFSNSKPRSHRLEENMAPLLATDCQRLKFFEITDQLHTMNYNLRLCSIMSGRQNGPIRLMVKPPFDATAQDFLRGLKRMGFSALTADMASRIETLLQNGSCHYRQFGFPLVHLDLHESGDIGPTLGIEFGGIRYANASSFPALTLAREWGLADGRWRALARVAQRSKGSTCMCDLNTLKFRWNAGEPLPAKLYLKVCPGLPSETPFATYVSVF